MGRKVGDELAAELGSFPVTLIGEGSPAETLTADHMSSHSAEPLKIRSLPAALWVLTSPSPGDFIRCSAVLRHRSLFLLRERVAPPESERRCSLFEA